MSAELFIERLQQQGLLDDKVVAELRRKLGKVKEKTVTAEKVANLLVEQGHLTKFQAIKLVAEVTGPRDEMRGPKDDRKTTKGRDPELQVTRELNLEKPAAMDDSLGLAPEPEAAPTSPASGPKSRKAEPQPVAPRKGAAPPVPPPVAPTPPAGLSDLADAGDLLTDLGQEAEVANPLMPTATAKSGGLRGLFGGGEKKKPGTPRKIQGNQWDSKLLLVGGGALGILLVLGGFLLMSLTRGSADKVFEVAEEAYRGGSYTQAVKQFEKFVTSFSSNPKASLARVRIGTARLWQAYKTPKQGLTVAQEVLPTIETEEAFAEARPELASMLPEIAAGFTEQAQRAGDIATKQELLNQAAEAMKLINNPIYIPTTLRKSQTVRIDLVTENMARVQREIDRDRDLKAALLAINQNVDAGQTQQAYQLRYELLRKYPGLDTNEELRAVVARITARQREQVKPIDVPVQPTAEPVPRQTTARVVFTAHQGNGVPDVQDHVVYVLSGGSVFGVDATSGSVLWSQFVGSETDIQPQPLSDRDPGTDAVFVDGRRNDLVRAKARTGAIVWRLPLGERFAAPVVTPEKIYVAVRAGKLLEIDPETGAIQRASQLTDALTVGPGLDLRRTQIYLPGEQNNVYVIGREQGTCQEVFYLGHKASTVPVPPVVALGYVFLVTNSGPDFCELHILSTNEQGVNLQRAQKSIRLPGHVVVPMIVVDRRRVLVVTDRRRAVLYDVEPNAGQQDPVTPAVELEATADKPLVSYPLIDRGYLWLADVQLTKFQIQTSTGKLPLEWNKQEQDVYVGPLRLFGSVIFHTRRKAGSTGVTLSAMRVTDERPQWETDLSVPTAYLGADPAGQSALAVSSRGQLYTVGSDQLAASAVVMPVASPSAARPVKLSEATPLGNGPLVLSGAEGYADVVVVKPEGAGERLQPVALQIADGTPTAAPTAFQGGMAIPVSDGRVMLVDPSTGGDQVLAFHPEIPAGSSVVWARPTVVSGGSELVVANNQQRIFRLGIEAEPQPHLTERAAGELNGNLVGSLAALQDTVFFVLRSNTGDLVVATNASDFAARKEFAIDGRVVWGPVVLGDAVLVGTEAELLCLEAEPKERWRFSLADHGGLVGPPLESGDHWLVACLAGQVLQLDRVSGTVQGRTELGEPLTSGPVRLGDKLLVVGSDGALLIAPWPAP